jgi:hypothetical protein
VGTVEDAGGYELVDAPHINFPTQFDFEMTGACPKLYFSIEIDSSRILG